MISLCANLLHSDTFFNRLHLKISFYFAVRGWRNLYRFQILKHALNYLQMDSKTKKEYICSKETLSVLWDILILEFKGKKYLLFYPSFGQLCSSTVTLNFRIICTCQYTLACFIRLILAVISMIPRDAILWLRDADSNLRWYKHGGNEEFFPKS